MQRLKPGIRVLATVAAVCSIGALSAPSALAQSLQYQSVRNVRGSITGVVSDDHGGPIAGAMVSALGTVTVAKAVTDATGFFSIDALPIGEYTLQAHRTGFLGSSRATVRVSGLSPALLRREPHTAGPSGPRWWVAAARRSTRTRWSRESDPR